MSEHPLYSETPNVYVFTWSVRHLWKNNHMRKSCMMNIEKLFDDNEDNDEGDEFWIQGLIL